MWYRLWSLLVFDWDFGDVMEFLTILFSIKLKCVSVAGAECCVQPDQTKYRTKSSNSWSLPHKALFTRYQIKLILTVPSSANKWISYHSWEEPCFFVVWVEGKAVAKPLICLHHVLKSSVLLRMVWNIFQTGIARKTHCVENFVVHDIQKTILGSSRGKCS